MKVYFCTSNEEKFNQAKSALSEYGIEVDHFDMHLEEPKIWSLEEIVLSKARQAFAKTNKPVIVEDTGVFFADYNNFPGAFTKVIIQGIGLKGVLRLVEGTSRKAVFKIFVAYKDSEKERVFVGENAGMIGRETRGESHVKMPYDQVFIPEGWNKTFGEATQEEKNSVSARRKAFVSFAEWFSEVK